LFGDCSGGGGVVAGFPWSCGVFGVVLGEDGVFCGAAYGAVDCCFEQAEKTATVLNRSAMMPYFIDHLHEWMAVTPVAPLRLPTDGTLQISLDHLRTTAVQFEYAMTVNLGFAAMDGINIGRKR
jgi:hypothetical protein